MRLTIRVILSMMSAVESALDEVCNKYRNHAVYGEKVATARKSMKIARQGLAEVLDLMIDSKDGE